MPEMLELFESIRAEAADLKKLFGGEGKNVSQLFKRKSPEYLTKLAGVVQFLNEVYSGQRPLRQFKEVMTTSDFPLLFGDVIDRQLLAGYTEYPSTWQDYCKRGTVPDFRLVSRFTMDGADDHLNTVGEMGAYPISALTEGRYQYRVAKYGRKMPFSWEAMVNDDLDALKDAPARFGRAARRTEDRFATALHVIAGGPDATVYSAAHRNLINPTYAGANFTVVNPSLSIAGLQEGMSVLANMLDPVGGEPIVIDAYCLEVPPSLKITAENILNTLQLYIDFNTVAPAQALVAQNWMKGAVKLTVNPYLSIINTVSGYTAWYLHASPSVARPAFEMGFLRGYEAPQVFMKSPNQTSVGGGAAGVMDGDFDTDSIEYKVRHVFGGVAEDFHMTCASTGLNV